MEFWEAIIILVGISCTGGVLTEFAKASGRRRKGGTPEAKQILEELKALRRDVNALQQGASSPAASATAPRNDPNLAARLAYLEQELAVLRDTTTQFDMSFDAALDRLEGRVNRVESRPADTSVSAARRG